MAVVNHGRLTTLALLQDLESQIGRMSKSAQAEPVHELRVKIRKLTQALRIFKSSFAAGAVKKIRRRVGKLMAAAGEVRDADIVLALLHKDGASAKLLKRFERRRKKAVRRFQRRLQPILAHRTIARWRTWLAKEDSPGASNGTSRDHLKRMTKRFADRGEKAASEKASPEKLHHLRIATKKLRYSMELLGPPSAARLERVQHLQSVLGKVNDYATATRLVSGDPGSRKMVESWKKRQGEKMKQFRTEWTRAFPSAS